MKVLNSLKKKSKTHDVRAWLLQIKNTCRNNDTCELCPYLDEDLGRCSIYTTLRRSTSRIICPVSWTIQDEYFINPEVPPNLDFLNHITWNDSGYPASTIIPELIDKHGD